jgi:hypothetical protein
MERKDTMEGKVVFLHGFSKDEALAAMRAVKAAVADPASIAFSMSTETNLSWKVSDLVKEVSREHGEMTGPGAKP